MEDKLKTDIKEIVENNIIHNSNGLFGNIILKNRLINNLVEYIKGLTKGR